MNEPSCSDDGLSELHSHLEALVADGYVPGALALVAHGGETRVESVGTLAFEGPRSSIPMASDTICRLGSLSKPIAGACAMTLVDDGTLRLDDPIDDLIPELSDMRVLTDPHAALDDTVPAARPITVRDVLTSTLGTGMVMAQPGEAPIADAMSAMRRAPFDEWVAHLGSLPLVHQPGERWLYHTASDVTGVLIARATGLSFGEALQRRVCEPLGMRDTAFTVTDDRVDRFAVAYLQRDLAERDLDEVSHGTFRGDPVFESGGGGIVSTADDLLLFARELLAGGERVLSPESVATMTSDQLTPEQKAVSGFWPGYFDEMGWAVGQSVRTVAAPGGQAVGTYGWPGYFGTAWYTDPERDLISIVMMQRAHAGNQRLPMWADLWTGVYRSIGVR